MLPKTTIIGINALPTFINRPLLECCATNKNDEAIAVLDKCVFEFPREVVNLSYFAIPIIEITL